MALSAAKTANSLGIGRLFAWVGLPFVLDGLGGCGLLAGGLAPVWRCGSCWLSWCRGPLSLELMDSSWSTPSSIADGGDVGDVIETADLLPAARISTNQIVSSTDMAWFGSLRRSSWMSGSERPIHS